MITWIVTHDRWCFLAAESICGGGFFNCDLQASALGTSSGT